MSKLAGTVCGIVCGKDLNANKVQLGSLLNYEPEIEIYLEGLTTAISGGQKNRLNRFCKNLKTRLGISALSDLFDTMYIRANETSEIALKNIVKNAHHSTAVGSPSFVAFEGFTGNAISSYLNNNYNPATQGVRYTINDCSIGLYSRTAPGGTLKFDMGANEAGANYSGAFFNNTANAVETRLNNGAASAGITVPDAQKKGMLIGSRLNSSTITTCFNKWAIPSAVASTGITSRNFYELARLNNSVAAGFSNIQTAFSFTGKGLTKLQVNIITDTFEEYMTSLGKGVLPTQTMLIIGDSLSGYDAHDWPSLIPFSSYRKITRAVPGSTIESSLDAMVAASANDNADIIIIAIGRNDDNSGNMAALQAELEENIAELKASNPRATIYGVNVLPCWTDSTGLTELQKNNVRTAVAAAYTSQGITHFDTYSTPWIVASDTSDGTHTTTGGAAKVWNEIAARI